MMTGEQVDYSGQNHLITLANSNLLNYLDGASLDVMQNQDTSFHCIINFEYLCQKKLQKKQCV